MLKKNLLEYAVIHRISGVYSSDELKLVFNELDTILASVSHLFKHHVKFNLLAGQQEMAVLYRPRQARWFTRTSAVDVELHLHAFNSVGAAIANRAICLFSVRDGEMGESEDVVLRMNVCCTQTDAALMQEVMNTISMTVEWNKIHYVTSAKANFSDIYERRWIDAAILQGQSKLVAELNHSIWFYKKNTPYSSLLFGASVLAIAGAVHRFGTDETVLGFVLFDIACTSLYLLDRWIRQVDEENVIKAIEQQNLNIKGTHELESSMSAIAKLVDMSAKPAEKSVRRVTFKDFPTLLQTPKRSILRAGDDTEERVNRLGR